MTLLNLILSLNEDGSLSQFGDEENLIKRDEVNQPNSAVFTFYTGVGTLLAHQFLSPGT